jgi:acyl-[acyl-carrier-protein]-phospholipid O-acyltransferase/long-chain-fatty-acid--[acyl-carrier-protein] ligase
MSSSSQNSSTPGFWSIRGIIPFLFVAFINAFVDLGHKIVIQNTVFKFYNGSTLVLFTAVIQAMILLPFVMVFTPAGFLSDKFAKDKVIRVASFCAIPIALLITFCYYQGWFMGAFWLTFALALQAAIYSPSKYGFIKELVGARNLAVANSAIQGLTIAAILLGTLCYTVIFEHFYNASAKTPGEILMQVKIAGWFLVALTVSEFLFALRVPRIGKADPDLKFHIPHYLNTGYLRDHLRDAWSNIAIRHSIIGLSVFWAVNQVLLSSFGAHLKEVSGEENTLVINGILAIAAIGIAAGSWYAARMSKNFIETGLIPFGALGLTVCLFALPHLHSPVIFGILFAVFGFFGGVLLVPFNSLVQYHTKENTAGHIIAANNFVQTVVMLLFLGGTILLSQLGYSQRTMFFILGFVGLGALLYSVYVLPQSMIRQLLRGVFSQRYKLQVLGIGKIPSEGGVLFLGNHISWIDWAFLQMSCPRPIRFVMHRDYYEKWYLRWLLNRLQVIPISAGGSASALTAVREALKAGDAVALFPEGHISRNGHLSVFRSGFEKAALDTGATIVPFYMQGLWGSNYSFAAGKYRQNVRGLGSRVVTVCFGTGMPCQSDASAVKQRVQELSIEAWSEHISSMRPLAQTWLRTAKRVGSAPAILGHDRVHFSGTKLLGAVLAFAPRLDALTRGESRVGVILPPSAGGVITTLALLMRGKTLVHMNYTSSPEVLLACARKAGLRTIFTSIKFREKLLGRGLDLSGLESVCKLVDLEDIKAKIPPSAFVCNLLRAFFLPAWWLEMTRFQKVSLDDTAAILFSSGSEGTPKGVELTHRNMVGNIRQVSSLLNPSADDIMLSTLPLFHAFGLTMTTLMPLLEGIPLVTQPDPTDAKAVGRLCAEHRVTILCGTSTFLRMYSTSKHVHPLMFKSMRLVVAGAEKLREDVRLQFRQKFGLEVFEGFGTTETTPVASVNIADILMDDFVVQVGHKPGTVGLPLPGSQFRVVDPVTLESLPIGADGLILVGGSQIMKGYLDDPERTQEAVVTMDGMRWYKSGDKGHVDADGFLTIVDRYSRFAKLGGEMVSLGAVESKLSEVLGKNEIEFLVTAIPDPVKGERVVLLFVAKISASEVTELMRSCELPPLWSPSRVLQIPELPRLGSGKLDYGTAKRLAAEVGG